LLAAKVWNSAGLDLPRFCETKNLSNSSDAARAKTSKILMQKKLSAALNARFPEWMLGRAAHSWSIAFRFPVK